MLTEQKEIDHNTIGDKPIFHAFFLFDRSTIQKKTRKAS